MRFAFTLRTPTTCSTPRIEKTLHCAAKLSKSPRTPTTPHVHGPTHWFSRPKPTVSTTSHANEPRKRSTSSTRVPNRKNDEHYWHSDQAPQRGSCMFTVYCRPPEVYANAMQGHIVTLEITSGEVYRGKLIEGTFAFLLLPLLNYRLTTCS